ncbi:polysaccharide deacetylase family protein [Leptospira interrogans]|uniref:Polysaccharide deacetylase-like protein n=5 Tax=Leptospira interrogans TaxID=173 RepID=Q8F5M9_LEPIN|nr:polysaccharide deacetylase family protein [Leptospira interrogans]APH41966.1 Polysaccharide deacetylase family protein [Leptospira interrogans serovar Copenhageni/Icterohaemorrhagiae]EMM95026.1 polysaccharide deacetylase [Leptospira interrogans serovar Zanoni str. LT2156]AAN48837.1 polysaccharide deacetylase-like protein [Leptospira interrogans serovar Lai str. 56601]AAS70717.1 polysaccharide deacetylase family protein [Leptospira interrogans serovar Copenhageni str. Fiocruz L1-130]AER02123
MSFFHKILAGSHIPLRIFNIFGRTLKIKDGSELRVLLYHDIPQEHHSRFRTQLEKISKDWRFVSTEIFEEMIRGKKEIVGRNLLLTFDDGYLSNKIVAEEILEPLGIKALFFIISDFVDIQDTQIKKFISDNIYPSLSIKQVPDFWMPMRWKDLEVLLQKGHSIGGHTKTHAKLSQIDSIDRLQDEILISKKKLEDKLEINIKHFAYTFGDLDSFSKDALTVARKHYEFIHTGLRGNNKISPNSNWAIRRESISPTDSDHLVGSILEGGADILYKNKLRTYESWGLF